MCMNVYEVTCTAMCTAMCISEFTFDIPEMQQLTLTWRDRDHLQSAVFDIAVGSSKW